MTEPWSNQSTSLIILEATPGGFSGLFVYSPVPGPGNLIGSWSASAGIDPYGNNYPAGLSSLDGNISGQIISGSVFEGTNFRIDNQGIFLYQGSGGGGGGGNPPPGAPIPYVIGNGPYGTGNQVITVPAGKVAVNDLIHVSADASPLANETVTGITDSAGNTYTQQAADATQVATSAWTAPVTAVPTSITVTYSGTTRAKNVFACGIRGLPALPVDQHVSAAGSSINPLVTSAVLAEATETCIATFGVASAGGAPKLGTGWTQLYNVNNANTQYLAVGYQNVNSTAAVSAGATIVSANWAAMLVTLKQV